MVTAAAPTAEKPSGKDGKSVPLIPFAEGSREYTEPFHDATTAALDADSHDVADVKVAVAGYLRAIWLYVTFQGGDETGADAVLEDDAPWSVFQRLILRDTNGQVLVGAFNGLRHYFINKYGGYDWASEPTSDPGYTALGVDGNGSFVLRIPVEVTLQDGYCSLPNQSSAQPYRMEYSIAPASAVFATAPGGANPTVRVRAIAECWDQPPAADVFGRPIQQTPPGIGSMQFWSQANFDINAGQQKVELTRLGNLIRNLVFIFVDESGVRQDSFPADIRIEIDNTTIHHESLVYRQSKMAKRYGFDPDTGVLVYDFAWDGDGHPGSDNRQHYIPTTKATKLTIDGDWPENGSLYVLTNDIAPAGLDMVGG